MKDINPEEIFNNPLFITDSYQETMKDSMHNILITLLENGNNFQINSRISEMDFYPEIEESFKENFGEIALFDIQQYSLDTFHVHEDDTCSFETGFGDNPGGPTVVTIPLSAIHVITLDYVLPMIVNHAHMREDYESIFIKKEDIVTETIEKIKDTEESKKSFDIFSKNPDNAKFFKK